MFSQWLDVDGEVFAEIDSICKSLEGYIALYNTTGDRMYVDNNVKGIPYKIVLMVDKNTYLTAELETKFVELFVWVSTYNGKVYQNERLVPSAEYAKGEVVDLRAVANNSEHRVKWTGTDNDASMRLRFAQFTKGLRLSFISQMFGLLVCKQTVASLIR